MNMKTTMDILGELKAAVKRRQTDSALRIDVERIVAEAEGLNPVPEQTSAPVHDDGLRAAVEKYANELDHFPGTCGGTLREILADNPPTPDHLAMLEEMDAESDWELGLLYGSFYFEATWSNHRFNGPTPAQAIEAAYAEWAKQRNHNEKGSA
jgi:hypothetical protein